MKRIFAVFIMLFLISFGTYAFAEKNVSLTFEVAKESLLKNSLTLKQLDFAVIQAQKQYDDIYKSSRTVAIEDIKRRLAQFNMTLDDYAEMNMMKQRELLPEQMQYYLINASFNRTKTENSLVISLRNIYLALASADCDLSIKQKKVDIVQNSNEQDKLKYGQGLISGVELEESDYNLLQAQKDVEAAQRNKENLARNLSVFIGIPIGTIYESINFEEHQNTYKLLPVENYINRALTYRQEIYCTQKEIALDEHELNIIKMNDLYKRFSDLGRDHNNLSIDEESLKLQLEKNKVDIEKEIKDAYIDIINAGIGINSLEGELKLQQKNKERLNSQYKHSLITKSILDNTDLGIRQLENSIKLATYDYNTKIMRLGFAEDVGPAY